MKKHKILAYTLIVALVGLFSCQPEDPPLNDFSHIFIDWSPRTINVNDSVSILDGSRGVQERLWTLPGGGVVDIIGSDNDATSTERILHAKFLQPGEYDIRLQDQFNDPSVTLDSLITITVLEQVSAGFTSDAEIEDGNVIVQAGEVINFTSDSTGSPEFFEWSFEGGDPSTSTGDTTSVQYNQPGSWDVTLIAYRNFPRGADTIVVRDYLTVLE
ncbi:PKD domain-containing protein [Salegentibacter sp. F188]|uniref:PKD domain-containing protein n=1 Tax=Autumnicola patrickiae TaxID=3075591 RepID=A0ABU3DZD9_9FLAO|nr:PKD domain-containing protein [Salegentibacter sp. F188]MDT0689086.1 PKD domain-containing protein [Salegentibacter sp. F188]